LFRLPVFNGIGLKVVDKKLIGQDGKPVPKLGRYERRQEERRSGALKGKIKIANDFDKLPEDIAQAFGMEKPSVIEKKYTGWHPAG
jgi:hypothetical protein